IAWEDHRGSTSDIYVQHVDRAGSIQWAPDGVALCAAAGDQFAPKCITDGAGGAMVTWEDYRSGTNADIYARRVNAAGVPVGLANGVGLCTASGDQLTPDIVRDGANGAIVTWFDARGDNPFDIYAQRMDSSGVAQWITNGVAISAALDSQEEPILTADG